MSRSLVNGARFARMAYDAVPRSLHIDAMKVGDVRSRCLSAVARAATGSSSPLVRQEDQVVTTMSFKGAAMNGPSVACTMSIGLAAGFMFASSFFFDRWLESLEVTVGGSRLQLFPAHIPFICVEALEIRDIVIASFGRGKNNSSRGTARKMQGKWKVKIRPIRTRG